MSSYTGHDRSRPFGVQLLESILNGGTASTSASAAQDASTYYHSRVEGRRVQLGNLDRAAPTPKAGSAAAQQIHKRTQRLVKKYKKLPRDVPRNLLKKEERRALSRRERKAAGLEKIDPISYEQLIPIYHLWKGYIQRLLGLVDEKGWAMTSLISHGQMSPSAIGAFQTSLVKADFCGAPMKVTRSLNPSLVGIEGLIAKETESTFVIVTKSKHPKAKSSMKCTKVIPKENSVFSLSIPLPPRMVKGRENVEIQVPLYGDQLCNTMPTRATKKFKARRTVDL